MGAFSLSKAALAKHCLYPFRDDVAVPADASSSEERDTGNSCHDAAAKLINGKLAALRATPAGLTWKHMSAWILEHYQSTWTAEVALAWDPSKDVARVLGVDIGREYEAHGLTKGEVPGTCDLVSVSDDAVFVYEFGTGFDVGHKIEQLRLQCVAAARAFGKDLAIGQLIQFRDDGAHPWAPIHYDAFDLSVIAGEFSELRAGIPNAAPSVSDACVDLFCDAKTVCPVTHEAQAALVPEGALTRKFSKDITDPEQARWMLERVRLVKSACEEIKDAINAYVPDGGIALADGKYIYEGAREMERFDSHKALALCKQLGATDAQLASLTRSVVEGAGLKVGSKKAADGAAAKRAKR
jgi:hypothetical protein